MTNQKFKNQIYSLLLVFVFFTSCNGQIKTSNSTLNSEIKTNTKEYLKLTKTQGSDEYQNIHCGLQDKKGNLWFGTTGEGVYRYNGKTFRQFTKTDGLTSNTIWSILEDKAGNIWLGTDNGVNKYDGKIITNVSLSDNNFSLSNTTSSQNPVWSIMQDRNGLIWFGLDDGLYTFNGKTLTRFIINADIVNKNRLTLKNIQCMFQDKDGNIWFGSGPMTQEGLIHFDGKSLKNYKPKNQGWIRNIIQDRKGKIVLTTRHDGICSFDGQNFSFISNEQGIAYNSMMACMEDKLGNLWFSSDYGTKLNDSIGGVWRNDGKTLTKFSTKDGLLNNAAFLLLEDKDESIWIGTRNCGLYRYDGKTFTTFSE